jgi:hypothetical protein
VYGAIGSAVDQVLEQVQVFAGCILGEIFALVLELWRTEAKKGANYEQLPFQFPTSRFTLKQTLRNPA